MKYIVHGSKMKMMVNIKLTLLAVVETNATFWPACMGLDHALWPVFRPTVCSKSKFNIYHRVSVISILTIS